MNSYIKYRKKLIIGENMVDIGRFFGVLGKMSMFNQVWLIERIGPRQWNMAMTISKCYKYVGIAIIIFYKH